MTEYYRWGEIINGPQSRDIYGFFGCRTEHVNGYRVVKISQTDMSITVTISLNRRRLIFVSDVFGELSLTEAYQSISKRLSTYPDGHVERTFEKKLSPEFGGLIFATGGVIGGSRGKAIAFRLTKLGHNLIPYIQELVPPQRIPQKPFVNLHQLRKS